MIMSEKYTKFCNNPGSEMFSLGARHSMNPALMGVFGCRIAFIDRFFYHCFHSVMYYEGLGLPVSKIILY